ncbi:MAG: helix-turn-helix domain-containing protein [Nocardioides sp.]
MSVAIATRVYGSEVRAALIGHYRQQPGSQQDAIDQLALPQHVVSKNVRILVQAGVLTREQKPGDARAGQYSVDEQRARELIEALRIYCLGE